MSEKNAMPPWLLLGMTCFAACMAAFYLKLAFEEGLSLWTVFRIAFWAVLLGFFLRAVRGARKSS